MIWFPDHESDDLQTFGTLPTWVETSVRGLKSSVGTAPCYMMAGVVVDNGTMGFQPGLRTSQMCDLRGLWKMGQPETNMLGLKTKWTCTWTKEMFDNGCSPPLNKFCHRHDLDSMSYSLPTLWDQLTDNDPTLQCCCVTVLFLLGPSRVTPLCLHPALVFRAHHTALYVHQLHCPC